MTPAQTRAHNIRTPVARGLSSFGVVLPDLRRDSPLNLYVLMVGILILAALVRMAFIIFAQENGGDWPIYERFAENILRGCGMSQSLPASADCIPDSGGYFPGHPAFIAFFWMLFGKSVSVVLFAQMVCYLGALFRLLMSLRKLTKDNKPIIAGVGLLLALSPLQMGWARYPLTETLALATSIWFLAEILYSISEKRLHFFHLAAALTAAVYIRPDQIFLAPAAFVVSFYVYDWKKALHNSLIFIILVSVPVSGWMLRNMFIGHAPLTMASSAYSVWSTTSGYRSWINTWIVNEYERSDALFPIGRYNYQEIKWHPSKFVSEDELLRARLLAKELVAYDGKPFPAHIDAKFKALANEKRADMSFLTDTKIYILRAYYLLLNPFSSWGLPLEIKGVDRMAVASAISSWNIADFKELIGDQITKIFGKIFIYIYRVILFLTFLLLFGVSTFKYLKRNNETVFSFNKALGWMVVVVALPRLTFFAMLGGLESRYMVEIIPWVECCVMIWLISMLNVKAMNKKLFQDT